MRFRALNRVVPASVALAFGFALAAWQPSAFKGQNPALPVTHVDNGHNSAKAQGQHNLALVSLNGFRWNYAACWPEHCAIMAIMPVNEGASAR
jgi:alkaline phosphatase D